MAELPSAWKIFNAICGLTDADLTESEVAVLLALCRFTDPGGGNIYPKQRTVAAILHIAVRTVTTAISGLRRKGYLEVEYHQQGTVVHYKFCLAKLGLDSLVEIKKTMFQYLEAMDKGGVSDQLREACEQAISQLQQLGIDPREIEKEYDALNAREREGVKI